LTLLYYCCTVISFSFDRERVKDGPSFFLFVYFSFPDPVYNSKTLSFLHCSDEIPTSTASVYEKGRRAHLCWSTWS